MGKPHKIVDKAINKEIEVFISEEILLELRKILERDFEEGSQIIEDKINFILGFANLVQTYEKLDLIKDDEDDNRIVECAVSAHANYIVSGDNHLLKLKDFQGIKILNSHDFLEVLAYE